jgi:ATP-dependent helicase/nuclease subunit A
MAEDDRLLYVAVTRAAHELVVGMKASGAKQRGPWQKLEPWLTEHAEELTPEPGPVSGRRGLEVDAATLRAREVEVADRRRAAGDAVWSFRTVTGLVRDDDTPDAPDLFSTAGLDVEAGEPAPASALGWTQSVGDAAGPGGYAWGNAVHVTLEAALGGLGGEALAGVARTALLENDRPVADGDPVELEALLILVDRLQGSDLWRRALAADRRLTEQPFVVERDDGAYLEGVVDLAFHEADGWVIVDYKTAEDDRVFALRLPHYRRQVALYADAWRRLTGEPVKEALVWRVG